MRYDGYMTLARAVLVTAFALTAAPRLAAADLAPPDAAGSGSGSGSGSGGSTAKKDDSCAIAGGSAAGAVLLAGAVVILAGRRGKR